VVLVVADDLGWADVGYNHGANLYETPHIDRLAAEGLRANRFYIGAANCAPSRATFLTGTYSPRHQVYLPQGLARGGETSKMRWKVPTRGEDESFRTFPVSINQVDPELVSLAEILKPAGYVSARMGKWHIGDDNQGFDVNSANGEIGFTTNVGGDEARYYKDVHVAERLTDASVAFVESHKDQPFFLYLAHWEVHTPIAARAERVAYFREKFRRHGRHDLDPVYAAEIEQVDRSVGRLSDCLERLGLTERTLFLFTSDNGGLSGVTPNAPLRGGKGTFYEGGIRVPFCARWPGTIEPGSVVNAPLHGVDLLPTLADLADVDLPTEQPVDGVSMLPVLTGTSLDVTARDLFFHFPLYLGGGGPDRVLAAFDGTPNYWRAVPSLTVIRENWKLIRYFEYDRVELYDLRVDVAEKDECSSRNPAVVRQLVEASERWIDEVDAPVPSVPLRSR